MRQRKRIELLRPLPKDLWDEHNKKKKKGTTGETGWYTRTLEQVATAAWWLRREPTQENLDRMDKALKAWDKLLGWDGKLRTGYDG